MPDTNKPAMPMAKAESASYERLLAAEQQLLVVLPHHDGLPDERRKQLREQLTDQALFVLLGKLELLVLDKPAMATLTVASLVETVEQAIAQAREDDVARSTRKVQAYPVGPAVAMRQTRRTKTPSLPILADAYELPEVLSVPVGGRDLAAQIALAGMRRAVAADRQTWGPHDAKPAPAPTRVYDGDGALWNRGRRSGLWFMAGFDTRKHEAKAGVPFTWLKLVREYGPLTAPAQPEATVDATAP